MHSPYATNETSQALWLERAIHASTHLGAIAYGLHVAIYSLSTYYGLKQKRISWGWLAYNTILLIMGTINLAASINFNQSAWIDDRNYPGGPYSFLVEQQHIPTQTIGNSASTIAATMAEGLLLYRVFVVWSNQWYVVILPTLFFLACTALAIITVIQIALPFSPTWAGMYNFGFSLWMMEMVLNLVLTLLLSVRLLYMRHKLRAALGTHHGRAYTSIAAIVIESAMPFFVISIIFLVLCGRHDETEYLFVPLLVQVECISPMLIILRVILGYAWSRKKVADAVSTVRFASASSKTERGAMDSIQFKHRSTNDVEEQASGSTINVL